MNDGRKSPHVADTSSPTVLQLAEAAAIVRAALADRRYGETPLGEHVVAYLHALEYGEASLNTLAAYEYVLGLFAVEHADLSLVDLEPPQGGGVVRAFLDRHWSRRSAATRQQRLAIVRSFLTWLTGEGLLRSNPALNIRVPKTKRRERRALPLDDVERLIAAQPLLRDQVALMLLDLARLAEGRAARASHRPLQPRRRGGHRSRQGRPRGQAAARLPATAHGPRAPSRRARAAPGRVPALRELRQPCAGARASARRATSCSRNSFSATPTSGRHATICALRRSACARPWPTSRPRGSSALAF